MNRDSAVVWKTRPTSVLCCVWERERDNEDDAIMKEGKAAMKLRIKQKKQLSGVYEDVTFPTGGNLQREDDGE